MIFNDDLQEQLIQSFWSGSRDQRHEAARAAVRAGAKVDAPLGPDGSTLLMRACALGQMESVNILLDLGADPMARRKDGACAMWVACAEHPGHLEAVAALWSKAADPTTSGPGGQDVSKLLSSMPGRTLEIELIKKLTATKNVQGSASPRRQLRASGR